MGFGNNRVLVKALEKQPSNMRGLRGKALLEIRTPKCGSPSGGDLFLMIPYLEVLPHVKT